MALDPGDRSISPESSGRDSPLPRQWRNQLGADDAPKDKAYRKYAAGVDRALALFDTAVEEWADYISFLNRLLKALQGRQPNNHHVPSKATVAKRLSQCLNPSLPSGVHQKALEVYNYVFVMTGRDGLSRDLPLYLPGLAPTLSFASLTVRGLFLDVLERHVLGLDPRALRPALRSIILALLPGLEEESSEDFERTIKLVDEFKLAVRPADSEPITDQHSSGDDFFWQCFFLAAITSQTRRPGALVYLVRNLPKLGQEAPEKDGDAKARQDAAEEELSKLVTSPEPGLLLRCFAAGLSDENALIQRGFLDLLVTHLPLSSRVLQKKAKPADLELLLRSASGVVTRRDMSLNRRLWAWLLGPDPATHEADAGLESPSSPVDHQAILSSKTSYFEEYGLHPLTQALLGMINAPAESTPAERARPYRICLSLMDRWEIGGLVVPEVFLPIVDSVRRYKTEAATKMDFAEVLRSASVFFDGVESGLIFGEILGLMAQALGPGSVPQKDRADKLSLVSFILTYFNVREEEMVTVHAPLTALSVLCMLQDARDRLSSKDVSVASVNTVVMTQASKIVADLIDMVLERTFSRASSSKAASSSQLDDFAELANMDVLKTIRTFYVTEQGNLEVSPPPLNPWIIGHLLLRKAADGCSDGLVTATTPEELAARGRILTLLLLKVPRTYQLDIRPLVSSMHRCLAKSERLPFVSLSAILSMATHLYSVERLPVSELSALVPPLVRHVWSYLSASEPKYHVESVRALWHLQTALGPHNRDIEAAISALMVKDDVGGAAFAVRPSNPGRSFAVLWSHTLQDTSLNADRRVPKTPGPKTPNGDLKVLPRLSGVDYFEIMLTRPLFLILDALLDERTQLFMTVKSWLYNLVNIDKLFSVFVTSFSSIPFLDTPSIIGEAGKPPAAITISEHDDLDLALYYLRTLSNVFRFSPDAIWPILATTGVSIDGPNFDVSRFSGAEGEVTLQEFFLQVCMRCISSSGGGSEASAKVGRVTERASQLYRCALTVLHQILLNPFAEPLSSLHLEEILIERLVKSLRGPDPYVQVLLLDVVFASLKLRDVEPVDPPTSPAKEPRNINFDSGRPSSSALDAAKKSPPPPSLLKCLQAGLAAESSRPVLDSWIGFLTECLPLYSGTIFQVLIPLVETFCTQIGATFRSLQKVFRSPGSQLLSSEADAPESTLISLLNGLEQILAKGHEELLAEEARAQLVKSPEQPQGFFGTMVPGIFASESQQTRSATANDRLTVLLAFQDAVRICCTIWSWGQGAEATAQDPVSASSFSFTSLRVRNRARRLLEHLFAAETLECLETVVEIWRKAQQQQTGSTGSLVDGAATTTTTTQSGADILHLLPALDGSRPKHTIPAIFNAIYSRTNPSALDPSRKSTLTISLQDTDLVIFLVDYARSLEDDAMDEIWTDCMTFLKDLLGNPFPHRQTLPSLLEFAAILGEKVDNTNFGEQRKMRRELGDLFLRLLAALFTTRPMTFTDVSSTGTSAEKARAGTDISKSGRLASTTQRSPAERAEDVVGILAAIVPNLGKILVEPDRVLSAANTISTNVIGPTFRAKAFPETVSRGTLALLQELSRLPNFQKTWKKDVSDAFNDARFFGTSDLSLVRTHWLPLLLQWSKADKDRLPELLGRITAPTTAGIVFGVGATSARLEADRRTQLNLRRIATLILASPVDAFAAELPQILDKLVELLGASPTSSPSSTTRAEVYLVLRALVLRTSAVHLAPLWPTVNAELHAALTSVVAPDHSAASDTYGNASVLQACKLLDLLLAAAPDDFQLHEWLFITDSVDAVYRTSPASSSHVVALADELSEELGAVTLTPLTAGPDSSASAARMRGMSDAVPYVVGAAAQAQSTAPRRTMLLGRGPGMISDDVSLERRDELVAKVLRPFFAQLSIFAFESTYAMGTLDRDACVQAVLRDLFDERTIVRAL